MLTRFDGQGGCTVTTSPGTTPSRPPPSPRARCRAGRRRQPRPGPSDATRGSGGRAARANIDLRCPRLPPMSRAAHPERRRRRLAHRVVASIAGIDALRHGHDFARFTSRRSGAPASDLDRTPMSIVALKESIAPITPTIAHDRCADAHDGEERPARRSNHVANRHQAEARPMRGQPLQQRRETAALGGQVTPSGAHRPGVRARLATPAIASRGSEASNPISAACRNSPIWKGVRNTGIG